MQTDWKSVVKVQHILLDAGLFSIASVRIYEART